MFIYIFIKVNVCICYMQTYSFRWESSLDYGQRLVCSTVRSAGLANTGL